MSSSITTDGANPIPPNGIGALSFTPLLGPNTAFAVIFGLLLAVQLVMVCRFWKYYGNAIGMLCGLLLELLGYVAKVQLAHNRSNKSGYIMYIIGLTLGPTFLSAALYLSIGSLMRQHPGSRSKHIGPRLFSGLFILGDLVCLCFIGVGGSLAAIYAWSPIGVDLMIAGLGTQILFTSVFCIILACIYSRIRHYGPHISRYGAMLGTAAACLFVRSCWRAAELSGGFNGPLSSKEGVFIALDTVPMITMSGLLMASHPGFWLESDHKRLGRREQGEWQPEPRKK